MFTEQIPWLLHKLALHIWLWRHRLTWWWVGLECIQVCGFKGKDLVQYGAINVKRCQFSQECAAVLLARMAVWRAEHQDDGPDVLRWVDRMLIRLVSNPRGPFLQLKIELS